MKVELEELFHRCQVASLHPPNLASTRGMITHEQPESMLPGSILLNTVCPLIVDQQVLREVLRRSQISAVLDVT